MSTPTIETPAPVIPAKPRAGSKLVRSKWFLLPVTAALFLIVGMVMGGSSAPPPRTVTVAGPATVTTVAPAECGTALDLASKFMLAVAAEHKALGEAFIQVGASGDMGTMAAQITAAENTLNAEMTADQPGMIAAAQVCRAAMG